MLLTIIDSSSNVTLLLVALSLVVAGVMKGTLGVGMPIIALPMVSMLIDVRGAVMLLSMPLILSNIPQALQGGGTFDCLVRLLPVIFGMMPGILVGVIVLLKYDPATTQTIAGVAVMTVATLTLMAPKLTMSDRLLLPAGMVAGFLGGILGGVAAMSGPLVYTFLLAKGLRGKDFIKEASLFLVLSSALLAVSLSTSSAFDWRDTAISMAALAPVACGMMFGQQLRERIPAETFQKIVLIIVMASGAGLVVKGHFT
jgi:uncharacterized membrane protein YfcA